MRPASGCVLDPCEPAVALSLLSIWAQPLSQAARELGLPQPPWQGPVGPSSQSVAGGGNTQACGSGNDFTPNLPRDLGLHLPRPQCSLL